VKSRLDQHALSIELNGQNFTGHYTVEASGGLNRLTVWFRGRSITDPQIAPAAEPPSTEMIARRLLRKLVEETVPA
jgi:hypothetical protein